MAKLDSTITVVLNDEARELIKFSATRIIQCLAMECKHHSSNEPDDNTFSCTLREIRVGTGGQCLKYE